ncbi:hypothetical protein Pcinc_027088 [Petrolisthes cinctipes]|uniref:Cell cycle control protein n=1 Tax=Petrolisthes cinctipes TaxID=88211 RepID=A0AAE1F5T1_PETCI|nr:hypothetical protein Pcinc_027088 [Petrolisthes cinctipes]
MSAQASTEQSKVKQSKFKQKFKQQRLPAWQPILTADTVLPAFFLFGLLFVPLGAALLFFSRSVKELQLDYTECNSTTHKDDSGNELRCLDVIDTKIMDNCTCRLNFSVGATFTKNVYLYYGLDNFYQNHRRYVKSRYDKQLLGKDTTTVSSECEPFDKDVNGNIYAPCGAIANSMFNDTLLLYEINDGSTHKVPLVNTEIAWPSDRKIKFKNPPGALNETGAFANTVHPPFWTRNVWELDPNNPDNSGYQNEDLMVWMRSAAFPTFRKLYRRVDHTVQGFKFGLPMGEYQLMVDYRYPVHQFGGRKRMILSTTSFLGGKNSFLGITYIAVGCVCLLLGVIFLIIHIKFGKRAVDLLNINQNTPYSD